MTNERKDLSIEIDKLLERRDSLERTLQIVESELTKACKTRNAIVTLEDCPCQEPDYCISCIKAHRLLNNL